MKRVKGMASLLIKPYWRPELESKDTQSCRAACHDKLTWAQRGPGRTNAVLMGSAGRKAAFCS